VAGEVKGQKLVVMAFAADRSERLGLTASYPLLLGNAIFWLAQEEEEERGGNNLRTGRVLDTEGEALIWEDPTGAELARALPAGGGTVTVLDRQGLWRRGESSGSASLLSKRESVLQTRADGADFTPAAADGGWFSGDLRPLLLWLAFALLLIEAWLFHRYAVY
jgi:hypothetical protein